MENDQPQGFAVRVDVRFHLHLGVGGVIEGISDTSAKADRAVMLRTEPTCLALPVEIAPKPSPKEPPWTLSNMVAQNTRSLPIRVSIACAHEMIKDHSPFLFACGGFGQAERPLCAGGRRCLPPRARQIDRPVLSRCSCPPQSIDLSGLAPIRVRHVARFEERGLCPVFQNQPR